VATAASKVGNGSERNVTKKHKVPALGFEFDAI